MCDNKVIRKIITSPKGYAYETEEIRQIDELIDRLQMPVYGQRAGRN